MDNLSKVTKSTVKKTQAQKLMKNEFSAKLVVACDPVDLPPGLMNYNNPIMLNLPKLRELIIDDVIVEYNASGNETEKRMVLGTDSTFLQPF